MLFFFWFGDALFGTSAKDNKRAGNLIYKDPKSKYEKFIERFVRRNKGQASRESVVRSAQEKWKGLRKDSAAVETYIAAKEGEEQILSLEESRLKSSHAENPERLHIGTCISLLLSKNAPALTSTALPSPPPQTSS